MIESILELLNREPFVPFRIVLTSGKEYEVQNPHLLAIGESQLTLYAPKSDKWSILRLNQISSVDVAHAA